jgi:TrpR family transcriptional regulator, trp operon repressor
VKKKTAASRKRRNIAAELKNLAQAIAGSRDPADILGFLQGILTPPEREKITLRWELVKLLEVGTTQRAVARRLGVSLCKITRGSKELKEGPRGFRRIMRRGLELQLKGKR